MENTIVHYSQVLLHLATTRGYKILKSGEECFDFVFGDGEEHQFQNWKEFIGIFQEALEGGCHTTKEQLTFLWEVDKAFGKEKEVGKWIDQELASIMVEHFNRRPRLERLGVVRNMLQ